MGFRILCSFLEQKPNLTTFEAEGGRGRGLHVVNQDMTRYRSAMMPDGFQADANPSLQLFACQGMHDTTHALDLMKTERKLSSIVVSGPAG